VEELMRRVFRHVERGPRLDPTGGLLTADHHFQIAGRHLDSDLVVWDDLQRFPEARRNGEPLNPYPIVVDQYLAPQRPPGRRLCACRHDERNDQHSRDRGQNHAAHVTPLSGSRRVDASVSYTERGNRSSGETHPATLRYLRGGGVSREIPN